MVIFSCCRCCMSQGSIQRYGIRSSRELVAAMEESSRGKVAIGRISGAIALESTAAVELSSIELTGCNSTSITDWTKVSQQKVWPSATTRRQTNARKHLRYTVTENRRRTQSRSVTKQFVPLLVCVTCGLSKFLTRFFGSILYLPQLQFSLKGHRWRKVREITVFSCKLDIIKDTASISNP